MAVAVAMVAVVPSPARADVFDSTFFPSHFGPNPYLSVAPANPYYRSVAVIDNTNDPSLSQWIQVFSRVMNDLHNGYNGNYPVMLYYQNILFAPGDTCSPGPSQFVVLCKSEALDPVSTPGDPGFTGINVDVNEHITTAVTMFRPSVVDPLCTGDKFTLVIHGFAGALGVDDNLTNPASALSPAFPVGRCTFNGLTLPDLDRISAAYNHPVG
ncbi:MAG: hypothetical protein QOG43_1782 [Actinomycetota bacterium]|jgi:hypothetical protein|nr:hypothetical protein [Actinomycetota bacterium]